MFDKFEKELELLILETLDLNYSSLEALELIADELEQGFSLNFSGPTTLAH